MFTFSGSNVGSVLEIRYASWRYAVSNRMSYTSGTEPQTGSVTGSIEEPVTHEEVTTARAHAVNMQGLWRYEHV